jgi:hypothetical protein
MAANEQCKNDYELYFGNNEELSCHNLHQIISKFYARIEENHEEQPAVWPRFEPGTTGYETGLVTIVDTACHLSGPGLEMCQHGVIKCIETNLLKWAQHLCVIGQGLLQSQSDGKRIES